MELVSYRKSVSVICFSSLSLVSVCSANTSADDNFVEPSNATVQYDEKRGENLGLKICSFTKNFFLTLLFLDVTLFFLYFLYNIVLVLWRKAVDFFSVIKFKYFYGLCFRTSNCCLVFNLRTKEGKKISSLDDIASKGKDKVRVKSEMEKDEKDCDEDFVEFNLENLSMEEEDIDAVENEYTSENMSPYGWKKGRYTKEEEKEKIQQIHNWVEGKDVFDKVTIGNMCNNGFERDFEYFRRGYDPKKGCCHVLNDSKRARNYYRTYIAEVEEVWT